MTKTTITELAKHLDKSRQSLHAMKKAQPKQFNLIWLGWLEYLRLQDK